MSLCGRIPSFLYAINWRPRRTTLFPYTTLFRSRGVEERKLREVVGRAGSGHGRQFYLPAKAAKSGDNTGSDRKSTRLNSSHVENSYAVFCLKKKNKKIGSDDLGRTTLRVVCSYI